VARRHTTSIERLLFDKTKFPHLNGSLFRRLLPDLQQDVYDLLQRLKRTLHDYLTLIKPYNLDITIEASLVDLQLNEQAELVQSELRLKHLQASTSFKQRLKWGLRDRKRAEKIATEIEDWVSRTRWLLEDVVASVSELSASDQLSSLSRDEDVQTAGLASSIILRTLLLQDKVDTSKLRIPADDLELIKTTHAVQIGKIENEYVAVERKSYETDSHGQLETVEMEHIKQLTALLCSHKDSNFKVLQGRGYINDVQNGCFMVIFTIPNHLEPQPVSLHELVSQKASHLRPQLGDRFKLAYALAESTFLLHSVGWIHKGMRSQNIVFFRKKTSETLKDTGGRSMQPPADSGRLDSEEIVGNYELKLMGFEAARLESETSLRVGDFDVSLNIYRHPERWGTPTQSYTTSHDLYSKLRKRSLKFSQFF
jgi:hypothetical protein